MIRVTFEAVCCKDLSYIQQEKQRAQYGDTEQEVAGF